MNYLKGFEPMTLDEARKISSTKHNVRGAVYEFLESGNECMVKKFDDEKEFARCYGAFKNFVYQNRELGVRVMKRGTALIIAKENPVLQSAHAKEIDRFNDTETQC